MKKKFTTRMMVPGLASVLMLLLPSDSHGVLLVSFYQDGNDVKAVTSGEIRVLNTATSINSGDQLVGDSDTLIALDDGILVYSVSGGTTTASSLNADPDNYSGDSFGYDGETVYADDGQAEFDAGLGILVNVMEPETTWTWENTTLSAIGLGALDSSGQIVYTADTTNDTISFVLVPEPSSTLMLAIAASGFVLRRKRKSFH